MRKGNFSQQVLTKNLYTRFRKEYPEHEISWTDFYQAWVDIADTIREEAVYNPLGVKLGSYTGELKLQYIPYTFKAIDRGGTNEIGEKINHVNILTKGKVARLKWERRWAIKRNKMLHFFAFEPTRKLKDIAKKYTDSNPDKIRVAREVLNGRNVWRKL